MEYNIKNNEKWKENVDKAKYHFKIADHLAYTTITLLKDNRLMIKILNETAESISFIISALLQKEYLLGKVKLYKDPESNLKTFIDKIAPKYIDKTDIQNIVRTLEIKKKHLDAPVEFVRKEKFVILLNNKYEVLTLEMLKEIMASARKLIIRACNEIGC
jgi:hypothetical protein